ncbi:MAG: DUF89 family protein [Kiritimatiellae bacterium]|nr:DUF89 family protein [Kiritimatiellia bacterium]
MKTYDECRRCFERQAADACTLAKVSRTDRSRVLALVRRKMASFPPDQPPVGMAVAIHEVVRSISGLDDPYAQIKRESNDVCRSCMPLFCEHLAWSLDPFSDAIKLAIAGNVLDFGAYSATRVLERDVLRTVDATMARPLAGDGAKGLREAVKTAEAILYIGDNAGECFLDRLLLECLETDKVTYVVRGGPILNDATVEDARAAGIPEIRPVLDTGDRAPGVLLERCSRRFREAFENSDLVIAKGQGNYESLSGRHDRTYAFLTKVKCAVLARDIGFPEGSNVVRIAGRAIHKKPDSPRSASAHR